MSPSPTEAPDAPELSVVVPLLNEEEVLEESVESVSCRWCGNGGSIETIESAPSAAG